MGCFFAEAPQNIFAVHTREPPRIEKSCRFFTDFGPQQFYKTCLVFVGPFHLISGDITMILEPNNGKPNVFHNFREKLAMCLHDGLPHILQFVS